MLVWLVLGNKPKAHNWGKHCGFCTSGNKVWWACALSASTHGSKQETWLKKSGKWSIWDHHRLRLNLKGPIQRHTYLNESVLGGKTPSVVNLCHKPFPTLPEVLQYAPSQNGKSELAVSTSWFSRSSQCLWTSIVKGIAHGFQLGLGLTRSHQVSPGETVCWTARLPRQLWRLHTWPSRSVNDEPMAVRLWFHQIFTIDFSCQAIKNQLHINIWDAS